MFIKPAREIGSLGKFGTRFAGVEISTDRCVRFETEEADGNQRNCKNFCGHFCDFTQVAWKFTDLLEILIPHGVPNGLKLDIFKS